MSPTDFSQAQPDALDSENHAAELIFTSLLKQFEADYALGKTQSQQKTDHDKTLKTGVQRKSSLAQIGLRLHILPDRLLELAELFPSCLRELKLHFHQQNLRQQALITDWKEDRIPQALVHYLNYIAQEPQDQQIRLYCGRLLIQQGEFDAASSLYQRGIEYGEDVFLLALKAELYLSQSKFIEAYNTALQARSLCKSSGNSLAVVDVELIYYRCAQWLGKEDLIYFPLMKLSQEYPEHLLLKARAFSQINPYCNPQQQLAKVHQAFQEQPHRYLHQAYIQALIWSQNYQVAYQEAQTLLKRISHNTETLLSLIICALQLSKYNDALKYCETLRQKLPLSIDALAIYLMVMSKQGQTFDTVQPLFEVLYAQVEHSPKVALYCADLLRAWNKTNESQSILKDLLHAHPTLFRVQLSYVEDLIREGDLNLARQKLDQLWLERAFEKTTDESQTIYPYKMHLLSAEVALLNDADEEFIEHFALCADGPEKTELEIRSLIRRSEFEQAKIKAMELHRTIPTSPIYLEYLINMIWQTEAEVLPRLIEIERGLKPATRQFPLLSLLAYLLVKQGESELSYALCEEILNLDQNEDLSAQRLMMACETAYLLKHKEALIFWGQKAFDIHEKQPKLVFYSAMAHWYSGEFKEALQLSLSNLEQVYEYKEFLSDQHFAEQLLVTTIWACELENYPQAKALLEILSEHQESDSTELEALTLRVYLNHDEEQIFNQGIMLAQSWLHDAKLFDYRQKVEFLVDWLLESVPIKSIDSIGEDEILFDDQAMPSTRHEERLSIALSLLNQYLDHEPQDITMWRKVAIIYVQLEDIGSAIFCLEHICNFDDCLAYDHYILSKAFESTHDFNRARLCLEQGLSLTDEDERFNYLQNLACILVKQGDHSYAQHIFEVLITQVYEEAQNELATLELEQDNNSVNLDRIHLEELKVEAFDTSVSELLHLWLAQSLNECDLSESLSLIDELSQRFSARILDAFKGLALAANGQSALALPLLEMAHEELGLFSGDYTQCLWTLGQREEAINILFASIAHQTNETEYYVSLVKWLVELKRFQEAYPLYLDLITLVPDHEARSELEQLIRMHLVYH